MPRNRLAISSGSSPAIPRPRPSTILAEGEVRIQVTIARFIGAIIIVLALGGLIFTFVNPAEAKSLWVIIGPIISGGISGAIGFLDGKKHASS